MDFLLGWVGLILGFSSLIFIHELGHFALAKWNGVKVYVFSLGMGPYLVSFTWHGTVYVLSMIPIGGYVKLQGQDDLNPGEAQSKDPQDYRNKRPGQKAAILAAGATFNLILTIFLFTMCYWIGTEFETARMGMVSPGSPLAKATKVEDSTLANLREGDQILEVNGVPVKSYLESMLQISGAPRDQDLHLRILQDPNTVSAKPIYVKVQTQHDKKLGASSIGLTPYEEKMVLPMGFKTRDVIIVAEDPAKIKQFENMPAAKSKQFQKGDEILEVGGVAIVSKYDLLDAGPRSKGEQQTFVLRRNGTEGVLKVDLTPVKSDDGEFRFGLLHNVRREVTEVHPESPAAAAGLQKGHHVFGFQPTEEEWVNGRLIARAGKLFWSQRADTSPEEWNKTAMKVPKEAPGGLVFVQERVAVEKYKAVNFGDALATAWGDTIRFSGRCFSVIRGLFTGDVSTQALSGAVGIGSLIYKVAVNQTFMKYLWFLGFISLNLGVLQFVPIPLLDGWHLLMVAIEKMKGSPVAPKVQEAFQYVGIFIVGGLLLFTLYNDVLRMLR